MQAIKAGDAISWAHYHAGERCREVEQRTGIVWSAAMTDTGISSGWWVHPDEPQASDVYHMIYVGRASRRYQPPYGQSWDVPGPAKGDMWSSDRGGDIPAVRMWHAYRVARDVAESNRLPVAA